MYLTRIYLDPRRTGCRELVSSSQRLHAAVLGAFAPGAHLETGEQRVLWRLDELEGRRLVLFVSSPVAPDPAALVEAAGWRTEGGVTTRRMDDFLDALALRQTWHFRITVNPTYRSAEERDGKGRKKVLGHVTVEQQTGWLLDRAADNGFRIPGSTDLAGDVAHELDSDGGVKEIDVPVVSLVGREVQKFRRRGALVTLQKATFEGVLEVTDPVLLRSALVGGIGRAKGYGCGLLTLSR
ncbi:MAG: type I-E CRISPR-associated protein Cas6/Cse3/CasE [Pauljensenia sp.]